jgi:hypothetical protein
MPEYGLAAAPDLFGRSRALFESIVTGLAGPDCGAITHAEVEERLQDQGRELMRQLFQDHADLRAAREERRPVVTGSDHVERARVERGHCRRLGTVFGEVAIERLAYRAVGAGNLYPADAVWNLPPGKHSHGLSRLVAVETTRGSFAAAQAAICRAPRVGVGKRQVEQAAVAAAADITAFYAAHRPQAADAGKLLVITCDGKGVVMRPEALRPATAKAAATSAPKLATRISPGEKTNRKRMAELVCVYDADPAIRGPEDIIAGPGRTTRAAAPRPKATGKWLTGSVTADIGEVIAEGFDEAERRDPEHHRTWVVLVDGNNTQIEAIAAEATRRGVTVHIVIDFIHVTGIHMESRLVVLQARRPRRRDLGRRPSHQDPPGQDRPSRGRHPPARHHLRLLRRRTRRSRCLRGLPDRQETVPGLRHRARRGLADRHRSH